MNKTESVFRMGIYLRKSRAEDGVQDLEKHKDYLVEIANKNKWEYELYEEIDSSQDLFRSELQRLRNDIKVKKIDTVMVHAVDRLSRRSRHFLEIIEDYFIEQGMTQLYVRDTVQDLTDTTTITMLQIQATLSQAEYSFIVSRLNEGRKSSVKEGIITGKLIYGYYFDKKKRETVIHEEEAKVVRMIIQKLLEGTPYRAVCDYLNELGYRTRKGNYWDIHNIKSIAHSPIMRGHVVQTWKDEKISIKNSHPALMTESEYLKISQMLENRANNYKSLSTAPKHYLQGLLKCPNCGRNMSIAASKPQREKVGDKVLRYGENVYYIRACRNLIKQKEQCGNFGTPADKVDLIIKDVIKEYQDRIDENVRRLMEVEVDKIKLAKKNAVTEIEKAIVKLEGKERVWLDMVGEGTLDVHVIFEEISKLKEQKSDLMEKLHLAEVEYDSVNIEKDIEEQQKLRDSLNQWDRLVDAKKRTALQIVFKEMLYIKLNKDDEPKIRFIPNM